MTSTMPILVESGPFTFAYLEWIPGEHGPNGALADISQTKVSANGKALAWRREKVEMYAFHADVPPEVSSIEVCSSPCRRTHMM